MLVNLNNIFTRDETEKKLEADFDFSAWDISCDAAFTQPVNSVLKLKKGDNGIFLKLAVHANATCCCARCLDSFQREFSFTREFVITPDNLTEMECEIPVDSQSVLDTQQLVRQELALEVDPILLCSEDCEGLCPVCGRPKREGCGCQVPQWLDPRLAALRELLSEEDNE